MSVSGCTLHHQPNADASTARQSEVFLFSAGHAKPRRRERKTATIHFLIHFSFSAFAFFAASRESIFLIRPLLMPHYTSQFIHLANSDAGMKS